MSGRGWTTGMYVAYRAGFSGFTTEHELRSVLLLVTVAVGCCCWWYYIGHHYTRNGPHAMKWNGFLLLCFYLILCICSCWYWILSWHWHYYIHHSTLYIIHYTLYIHIHTYYGYMRTSTGKLDPFGIPGYHLHSLRFS